MHMAGVGSFLPFMTTLASRLLTDFTRTGFGHLRKPLWLTEKSDPLWDLAYRLLIVENYAWHEVIERLSLGEPQRERWFIEEVVTTIRTRCPLVCQEQSALPPHSCPRSSAKPVQPLPWKWPVAATGFERLSPQARQNSLQGWQAIPFDWL